MAETLTDAQKDYIKKEAEKLNKELEKLLAETRSREKYSITIIAGIASWLMIDAENLGPNLRVIISTIPLITTLFLGLSVLLLYQNIKWIGSYLSKIEEYFLGKDREFGWEKEFDKDNKKSLFVALTWLMWIVQLVAAATLMGYFIYILKGQCLKN